MVEVFDVMNPVVKRVLEIKKPINVKRMVAVFDVMNPVVIRVLEIKKPINVQRMVAVFDVRIVLIGQIHSVVV